MPARAEQWGGDTGQPLVGLRGGCMGAELQSERCGQRTREAGRPAGRPQRPCGRCPACIYIPRKGCRIAQSTAVQGSGPSWEGAALAPSSSLTRSFPGVRASAGSSTVPELFLTACRHGSVGAAGRDGGFLTALKAPPPSVSPNPPAPDNPR